MLCLLVLLWNYIYYIMRMSYNVSIFKIGFDICTLYIAISSNSSSNVSKIFFAMPHIDTAARTYLCNFSSLSIKTQSGPDKY